MSQTPPEKRQRTEEPKDKDQTSPVQSTYWFDDGNIILHAENTQFRLHRSLLSRHSNVFKDMFSLPQPANDPDLTPEGCPVVFLSDKVTDLECVMSVIYDSIRVHDLREKMSINFIGSILRLGKKYDIDYLCEEGLKRLRLEFPRTLKEWHASMDYTHIKPGNGDGSIDLILTVLRLGYELSVPSCLPLAFLLFVALKSVETILGSSVENGGTLDHEIVIDCLKGRDKLLHAYHAELEFWMDKGLFLPSKGCPSKSTCAGNKAPAIRRLSLFRMSDDSHFTIDQWDPEDLGMFHLCTSCLASIKEAYECTCENLWSKLPTFFGLPPWQELKDFDM